MENQKFAIYFDGLCPLCTKEIKHYKKIDKNNTIDFIDISNPSFDSRKIGIDPVEINKKFHVKTTDGQFIKGVEAFIAIWKHLDIFRPLQLAAQSKLGRPFFNLGYKAFAFIRPVFRRKDCPENRCEI